MKSVEDIVRWQIDIDVSTKTNIPREMIDMAMSSFRTMDGITGNIREQFYDKWRTNVIFRP